MVVVAEEENVNHGRTTQEWTGQSMLSLMFIAYDRSRWAAITVEAFVGVLIPNDAWVSRELVNSVKQ